MLRGERVLLRSIEREDLPWLWEHHNDYEVGTLVNDGPPEPQSLARLEADFDRDTGEGGFDGTRFAIEAAGILIGRCELFDFDEIARNCKLGISLSKEYWGQGFGREAVDVLLDYAFDKRNLEKVHLDVLEDNERAIRAYEACGFKEEGRLRRHAWHEGAYKDLVVMGVLRSEWRDPPKAEREAERESRRST
jgi:RimJ/RimL family protein N-acetyltransferase